MKGTAWTSVIAAVAALAAGCAMIERASAQTEPPCREQICFVQVTVTGVCQFSLVKPDPIHIARGRRDIHWDLVASGRYKFTPNGITINNGAPVFTNPQRLTDTKYKWTDDNQKQQDYKYNIEVTDGERVCRHDPIIAND